MKIIWGALAAILFGVFPAKAEILNFNNSPSPIDSIGSIGASFTESGYLFDNTLFSRRIYNCDISSGCTGTGIAFGVVFHVSRPDGEKFSLNSLFLSGGLNYDGAAPDVTPGTVFISAGDGAGGSQNFVQKISVGTLNVGFKNVAQFTLSWNPDVASTPAFFDNLDLALAGDESGSGSHPEPGGVPEPVSWAMMVAGFGLTGTALRRNRRKDVVPLAL